MKCYEPTEEYQTKLEELRSKYKYRLDTNYAKMDRVVAAGVETFKTEVLAMEIEGRSVSEWIRILRHKDARVTADALEETFGIKDDIKTAEAEA